MSSSTFVFSKRLGRVWLNVTNTTVLQTGDSKGSVVALGGYMYTGNCCAADHTLFAAAILPLISKLAHFYSQLASLNCTIFYVISFDYKNS